MNKRLHHIIAFFVLLAAIQACNSTVSKMPDLRESFSYTDNRPFGTSVAYAMLQNAYPQKKIEISKKEFADNYGWDSDTASLYFNISRSFYVNERDAQSLLDFVYKGNTAFISAGIIDTSLFTKIYCTQAKATNYFGKLEPSNTAMKFIEEFTISKESYSYFYYPFGNFYPAINGDYALVVGYNDSDKANFFVFFWGKGKMYIHSEPRGLSNYFLLTNNNNKYLQKILQMMPEAPANIYWDNFYGKRNYSSKPSDNSGGGSSIGTLMKYPPLAKAFFICLGLLLLYVLFNSKRRQRIVPIVKPPENTSIAFAEAIAGLYLSKKDNKVVAEKMITYFNEHVRTKYYLNIHVQDETYADVLSRKSGVPIETTNQLAAAIKKANNNLKVSDEQLLLLNGLVEKFFKSKS